MAVGGACGLAALPANALELGDIQVNSALGEPLRASIAYALNPTEQLNDYCIYLRPGLASSGLPAMSSANISLTDQAIILTGKTPIREPMMSLQVAIDCAYTPNLVREYTLMLDPAKPVAATGSFIENNLVAESATQTPSATPAASATRSQDVQPTEAPVSRVAVDQTPIAIGSRYRVRPGDTLSTIISRIENRTIGLWPAVDLVFQANPAAFVDQDVNRLMAGTELFIPDLNAGVTAAEESATSSPTVDVREVEEVEPVTELVGDLTDAGSVTANDTVPAAGATANQAREAAQEAPAVIEAPVVEEAADAAPTQMPEMRPGDVIMSPIGSTDTEIVISDTAMDDQSGAVPGTDTASPANTGTTGAWNWLLWLGGTGVALILALLLFGRALRERFGKVGFGTAEVPARRQDDDPTQQNRTIKDVDFEFEDTINAQAISLDADLDAGTGFNTGSEMDVAQDFGFSATGQVASELDMEITVEAAREEEASPTDVIPPNHREEMVTILESEEPPGSDDGEEYDLSMIVDATKQPIGDYDATAKDLQAVKVEAADNVNDEYTMSSAVDYQTLEQDYQEEFTATQAANAEIEKAAMELARRMEEEDAGKVTAELETAEVGATDAVDVDLTTEMPGPDVTEKRPAVELPTVSDPDVTAELTANLPTTVEAENDAVANDVVSEITVEMSAGSDITVDMQVESGKVDTKKKAK